MADLTSFDPYQLPDDVQQCPYPAYAEMRDQPGLVRSDACNGFWTVSRYDDVLQVLQDADTFGVAEGVGLLGRAGFILPETDPPMHRRYRRAINPWFLRDAVEQHAPRVRSAVATVLDRVDARPEVDLVSEVCRPYVALVNSSVVARVGDEAEVEHLAELINLVTYDLSRARDAIREIRNTVKADIAVRRTEPPRGDALDDVIHDESPEALTDDEVMAMYLSMVFGAFDTTANTLAVALAHLAAHPEARRALAGDPTRIPGAVDEYLRWDPTSQGMARTVRREVEVGGQLLHEGDRVYVLTGSANRDPLQFSSPEDCDLDRTPNRHVGFGAGPHRCLGMHLANLLLRVGVEEVLARWPDVELVPGAELSYRTSQMRALVAVPVRTRPAA
jgi:cytochrome P450